MTIIVARARNGVIGRNGKLPWHLPEDLAHFKRTTMGHPIIMGRRTWASIGRALPGRKSIVVSRDPAFKARGAQVVADLVAALEAAGDVDEVFVIGGARLYYEAMPLAHKMIVTEIDADFEGDTFLGAPDQGSWHAVQRESHRATTQRPYGFDFVTYERGPAT